jgi:hypothetical protein
MEVLEIPPEVRLVVLPCYPVDTGGGFAFERVERRPERVDVDMVEKRGEPPLLPLPCGLPYAVQRLGSRAPGSGSGACFADPRSPWPLPLAPPPPLPVTRLCSAASQLLRQSLTSPDRASATTAPRLPAADRQPRGAFGRPGDLPVPLATRRSVRIVGWSGGPTRRELPETSCAPSTGTGHVPRRAGHDGCPVGSRASERQYRDGRRRGG